MKVGDICRFYHQCPNTKDSWNGRLVKILEVNAEYTTLQKQKIQTFNIKRLSKNSRDVINPGGLAFLNELFLIRDPKTGRYTKNKR